MLRKWSDIVIREKDLLSEGFITSMAKEKTDMLMLGMLYCKQSTNPLKKWIHTMVTMKIKIERTILCKLEVYCTT